MKIEALVVLLTLSFSATSMEGSTGAIVDPATPWYTTDSVHDQRTFEKLNAWTVSVRWNNLPVEKALEDLASLSKQTDPQHFGVRFNLKNSDHPRIVNVVITDVSLINALGYLCQQADLDIQIYKSDVVLQPKKSKAN